MVQIYPRPIFSHSFHTPAPDAPTLDHDALCQAKMAMPVKWLMANVEIPNLPINNNTKNIYTLLRAVMF